MKKDSEILECAAKLLEEYGWQQGLFGSDPKGPHCLVGALWVCGGHASTLTANFDVISPIIWNDRPGQSKDKVIAALRSAAEVARQKESAVDVPSVPNS